MLLSRLYLRWRGLGFHEGDPNALDKTALVRIDAVSSAGRGLGMSDPIRGAYFQTKNLLLALDAGDPRRIASALALEVMFNSAGGSATRAGALALLEGERRVAARVGTPAALALADVAAGYVSSLNGDWRDAKAVLVAASSCSSLRRRRRAPRRRRVAR